MVTLQISTQTSTGLSAYINPTNGEAFMTKNMIAKLLKLEQIQITRIAQSKGIQNNIPDGVQLLTGGGLQRVDTLVKASDLKVFIKEANKLPSSDKGHLEVILDALIDAGATAYIYNVCGYQMTKVEPNTRNIDAEFDIAGKMAAFLSGGNKNVEMQQRFRLAAVIEPKFAGALEEAKKEYADANSVSFSKLLNAGDISNLMCERGIVEYNTAVKVNNLMAVKGLQTKPRKNWKPTALAKKLELCNEVDSTAPTDQKTNKWIGKSLKWNIEIVDYLINSLEEEVTVEYAEDTKTYMPSIGEKSMTDCMPEFDFD